VGIAGAGTAPATFINHSQKKTSNSSANEIANVNFLHDIVHVLRNLKYKKEDKNKQLSSR